LSQVIRYNEPSDDCRKSNKDNERGVKGASYGYQSGLR